MSRQISVSELAQNPDKYVDMAASEDIIIARNGTQIARLTHIKSPKESISSKLFGILPKDADLDKAREEHLAEI